jgi:ABC-type transport system substrate-binding protein
VVTRAETRWTGTNRGGYLNPRVDVLLDRLALTIDSRERLPLHRELLKEQMDDIALMPLVWEVMPLLVRKDVKGPRLARNEGTLNIHEWTKQ